MGKFLQNQRYDVIGNGIIRCEQTNLSNLKLLPQHPQ
jgi:hypothetical protein